jgi:hypothetical protein
VVGFVPQSEDTRNWSPFLLLRRPFITIPPRCAAGLWLTIDSAGVPAGEYSSQIVLRGEGVSDRTLTLQVQVAAATKVTQPVLVSGYTSIPEGEIYVRDFADHHMRVWQGFVSKAEMKERGLRLAILQVSTDDEAVIRAQIDRMKNAGLDYDDWIVTVKDEPHGTTQEELKPYIDIAKAVRRLDPQVRLSFNPGESAPLETFQVLEPYCDFWLPYTHHRVYPPSTAQAKKDIFTSRPWLWYTTPDLYDKKPSWPNEIYSQIREVPVQRGLVQGTAFFAFYYPFRDSWDTAHEFLSDAGVVVLPSRHGPVATRGWEAIREGIQDADLARVVKVNLGPAMNVEDQNKLLQYGTTEELLQATGGR